MVGYAPWKYPKTEVISAVRFRAECVDPLLFDAVSRRGNVPTRSNRRQRCHTDRKRTKFSILDAFNVVQACQAHIVLIFPGPNRHGERDQAFAISSIQLSWWESEHLQVTV